MPFPFRKITIVVWTALVYSGCGPVSEVRSIDDAPKSKSMSNHTTSHSPIHSRGGWRQQVRIHVEDSAPHSIFEATQNAVAAWNQAAEVDVLSFEGWTAPLDQRNLYNVLDDQKTVIYYDENWLTNTGKSSSVLGTTVWENDAEAVEYISRGDIILNAQNYYFQDSLGPVEDLQRLNDIADAETVIIHEIGHLLGLDHVTDEEDSRSVMLTYTAVGLGLSKRSLSEGDKDRIRQIYGR